MNKPTIHRRFTVQCIRDGYGEHTIKATLSCEDDGLYFPIHEVQGCEFSDGKKACLICAAAVHNKLVEEYQESRKRFYGNG